MKEPVLSVVFTLLIGLLGWRGLLVVTVLSAMILIVQSDIIDRKDHREP